MHVFGMKALDGMPSKKYFPTESVKKDSLQRRWILHDALRKVSSEFVDLNSKRVHVLYHAKKLMV